MALNFSNINDYIINTIADYYEDSVARGEDAAFKFDVAIDANGVSDEVEDYDNDEWFIITCEGYISSDRVSLMWSPSEAGNDQTYAVGTEAAKTAIDAKRIEGEAAFLIEERCDDYWDKQNRDYYFYN